jgi:predicted dehydrogenase
MSNRRDFIKLAGFGGLGATIYGCGNAKETPYVLDEIRQSALRKRAQTFNMCGYAAPKIDTVRIAYIGTGGRGTYAIERIMHIAGVEVKAVCDIRSEKAEGARKKLEGVFSPDVYTGKEDWKKVCERNDVDLVYICTHWDMHAPIAIYAMEHGKHVAVEIPAAQTVDECWQLVETSERTKKHCMMLENCCYDFFEMLTINMARQGFFGDIIHVEGAYIHDGFESLFDKNGRWNLWRLKANRRTGSLYPTHGIGPVCQALNVNRGDKLEYLVSLSSDDFSFAPKLKELAAKDPEFAPFLNDKFRGNINTTSIRTAMGRSMMIQHDYSSPRPYSRIHLISGTRGIAQKYPLPEKIAVGHEWMSDEEMKKVKEQYTPELIRRIGDMAKQVGGHGGMDFLMDWRLIDCLRNGLPLDQDVYDAALWSVIIPLSIWSVANKSATIDIPDFTCGKWTANKPFDITLNGGGTTEVI